MVKPSLICSGLPWLSKVTVQPEGVVLLLGLPCPLGEHSTGDSSGRIRLHCSVTVLQWCSLNNSKWAVISFAVAPG